MNRSKKQMARTNEHEVLFIRGLPFGLKAEFKALCIKKGTTMTSKVIEFMKREVRESKNGVGVRRNIKASEGTDSRRE